MLIDIKYYVSENFDNFGNIIFVFNIYYKSKRKLYL